MVLDAWIIQDIKRKEQERRRDQERPRVYIDISDTVPSGYRKRETPSSDRGVVIIPSTEEEEEEEPDQRIGTVINFATVYTVQYNL